MKSQLRYLSFALATLVLVLLSQHGLAQTNGRSSGGSASSAGKAKPATCPTLVDQGQLRTAAPNPNTLNGTLVRENCENGCITGTLKIGDFECKTLELEWNDNTPNKSCIPVKKTPYVCKRVNSPRFGNTFEVSNVEGRTHVLFHSGNFPKNTSGCILLGMEVNDKNYLTQSKVAVKAFMEELQGYNQFSLTIIDQTGTCSSSSSRSIAAR